MQAQRYIEYETEKFEILSIYLHEINYQLKQSDKKNSIQHPEQHIKT